MTHCILIDCVDEKGLVHRITGVLYRHDLNIISNHEFVDRDTGHFFMRTEFAGDFDGAALVEEIRSSLPGDAVIRLSPREKKKIVVMASREHHCLGDLLLRHEYNRVNARIMAVISNHDLLRPLVEKFNIPWHHVSADGISRQEHETRIMEILDGYGPEYIVLAKYMRIFTPAFVERYPRRVINIHHSFLPAFIGANPYRQAYERGVKIIGATAHFVNTSLDEGPIIAQSVTTVDHGHSVDDMVQSGKDIEKLVLARALKLAFEDRIFVNGNKTIIFD